ncbi:MAG: hypothetical protein ACFFDH_20130 [Promethearchaeota archaeon]
MSKINFSQNLIQQAEDEYNKLHLAASQKELLASLAHIFNQYIHIPERAMRGFIFRVVRDYQVEQHIILDEELNRADKTKRAKIATAIVRKLRDALTRVLISPEEEPLLDEAIKNAFNFYKEQLNRS